MNGPCFSVRQIWDRDQDRQNRNDAELEAAREADSFSFGRRQVRFNTRFYVAPTQGDFMQLPDIEEVSAAVHEAWIKSKQANGVTTRKSEDGEELMVPYADLTDKSKELDRGTVRAVYTAIEACAAA